MFLLHHSLKLFLQTALHFCLCANMGHVHFSTTRYALPVSLTGLCFSVLFSCRMPEKSTMKTRPNVCSKSPHPLCGLEKKSTFEPKLTNSEAYCMVFFGTLSCVNRLYLLLKNLLTLVSLYGQTKIGCPQRRLEAP